MFFNLYTFVVELADNRNENIFVGILKVLVLISYGLPGQRSIFDQSLRLLSVCFYRVEDGIAMFFIWLSMGILYV